MLRALPTGAEAAARPRVRRVASAASAAAAPSPSKRVLIVNTPSGAHAPLGYYLAASLRKAGHAVTVLVPCKADSDKLQKPPYTECFDELRTAGVDTPFGDLSQLAGTPFDVVVDNSGKDLEAVEPVIGAAKASGASQFLFVSSAGMYASTDEPPHLEGDKVKADAGHAGVEAALRSGAGGFASWASFRPQYLTGRGSNKDCEEWFFDRISRSLPLPIPGPGCQLTVVSHAEDVAAMLAAAVERPSAAHGHVFNAVTDRCVSLDGFARLCAKAAGVDKAAIVHWDPKKVKDVDVKDAFPFRPVHFYSEPRAAKALLGWAPKWDLEDALAERWAAYEASGRSKKNLAKKMETDAKILAALAK